MSPLDPLNEIGYMPPPSNLEDQIQLTPTIFGAPFFRFIHLHVQMPVEEMAVVFYFYIDK